MSKAVQLSIDNTTLLTAIRTYRKFLIEIDKISQLKTNDRHILNCIRRYERIWLPLLKNNIDKDLQPPKDVEFIWIVHLQNKNYGQDSQSIIGQVCQRGRGKCRDGKKIWEHFTQEPYLNDFNDRPPSYSLESSELLPTNDENNRLILSYLLEDVKRQLNFSYHIALPHYNDKTFLNKALQRYKLHLLNLQYNKTANLYAPIDIQLVCKTHMLFYNEFQRDCKQLQIVDFISFDGDFKTASKLWIERYNERLVMPGCMERPCRGKLEKCQLKCIAEAAGRISVNVEIVAAKINVNYKVSRASLRLIDMYDDESIDDSKEAAAAASSSSSSVKNKHNNKKKYKCLWNSKNLSVDEKMLLFNGINKKFNLIIKPVTKLSVKVTCNKSTNSIKLLKTFFKPLVYEFDAEKIISAAYEFIENDQNKLAVILDNGGGGGGDDDVSLELALKFSRPHLEDVVFSLKQEPFQNTVLHPRDQTYWQAVPLPILPRNVENQCCLALHHLIPDSNLDSKRYRLRILHSFPMKTSAIQVLIDGRIMAVGHTISSDQLPTPGQTEERTPTLNERIGERAILIKDSYGDWAIIKGLWQRTSKSDKGRLSVKVYYLRPYDYEEFIAFDGSDKILRLKSANVSLKTGRIRALPNGTPVNGQICIGSSIVFAMGIALLCTLCEPRPQQLRKKDAEDKPDCGASRTNTLADQLLRELQDEHKPTFVDSAGFLQQIASNAMLFLAAKGLLNAFRGPQGGRSNSFLRRRSSIGSYQRRLEEQEYENYDHYSIEDQDRERELQEEDEHQQQYDNITSFQLCEEPDVFNPWGETGDEFLQSVEAGIELEEALNGLDVGGFHDTQDEDIWHNDYLEEERCNYYDDNNEHELEFEEEHENLEHEQEQELENLYEHEHEIDNDLHLDHVDIDNDIIELDIDHHSAPSPDDNHALDDD